MSQTFNRQKILVVDDEPFNQMSLKFLITLAFQKEKEIHSNIDFASNGQEAVEMVECQLRKGEEYGLIFMDCSMPILDGYRAT